MEIKKMGKEREPGEGPESLRISERLESLLKMEMIPYRVIPHAKVYTALELAESIHAPGREVAKVVIVRAASRYFMAVLPSHKRIDLIRFAAAAGVNRASLATESEMETLFPDCEAGTMPPFGGLYGMPVILDESLAREPVIYFKAGSHRKVIEMRYQDFISIVHPKLDRFTMEPYKKVSGF